MSLRSAVRRLVLRGFLGDWHRARRIRDDARRFAQGWSPLDQRLHSMYAQFLRPGDLYFDVGANVGNRVKVCRRIGARVIAIEPQPECATELRRWYASSGDVVVVEKALGDGEGSGALQRSSSHVLASMSSTWISATKESGRFSDFSWNRQTVVPVTTLDNLISIFGVPQFTKIDVEGYEYQVLKGLSKALPALSVEFTPETFADSVRCIDHLTTLGQYEFNFSHGETMSFTYPSWLGANEMTEYLKSCKADPQIWGDIYARLNN